MPTWHGGGELYARAVAFKPEAIGANEIFAVERAVDLEKLRQSAHCFFGQDLQDLQD